MPMSIRRTVPRTNGPIRDGFIPDAFANDNWLVNPRFAIIPLTSITTGIIPYSGLLTLTRLGNSLVH